MEYYTSMSKTRCGGKSGESWAYKVIKEQISNSHDSGGGFCLQQMSGTL